jgi:hypothetical protein
MAPPVVVLRREPLEMVEMAKLVEVAALSEVSPEMVTAPAKVDVIEVDVAKTAPIEGVEVPIMRVPSKERTEEFGIPEALVPPLATGSTPVT